jgi:hypothetical protein
MHPGWLREHTARFTGASAGRLVATRAIITAGIIAAVATKGLAEDADTVSSGARVSKDTASNKPDSVGARPDQPIVSRLRVFLDVGGDTEYLRTAVRFVDYVRDRKDAQVHVLGTWREAGNVHTMVLTFIGLKELEGRVDTLTYTKIRGDTRDVERAGIARVLRLGFASLAARSGAADQLAVMYATKPKASGTLPARDPWNHWSFSIIAAATATGEKSASVFKNIAFLVADRTTAGSRIRMSTDWTFYGTSVTASGTTLKNTATTQRFGMTLVRTNGKHWGSGIAHGIATSEESNQKLMLTLVPVVEYNVFPYSEYDRRNLVFQVGIGGDRMLYNEETLYFLTEETRPRAIGGVYSRSAAPWGTFDVFVESSTYLDDRSKYHISSHMWSTIRLFRGFEMTPELGFKSIHDQLSLPRAGASIEDVLLKRRELATSYRLTMKIGFGYTFGSILNKSINPVLRYGPPGLF